MGLFNLKKTYSGDVPPKSTSAIYCGASTFRDACYQLVSGFLITYITLSGVLAKDPKAFMAQISVISIITIICLVWDGINDPIMGWIIEKVHFKWGKYKPWILIGGLLNTVVVLVLFLAHPTGWGFVALFAIFYFLWDIAWTINDIAYWSMLPSLTKDEKRRNKITSIMQICISIGVFGVYGAVPMLVGAFDGVSAQTVYGIIAIVVVTLYLISQIVLVVCCKEHKEENDEAKPDEVKFKDMVTLYKKNDQFRINIIAILLNYLGAGTVVGFGMYYFYLRFGYGSQAGGNIQFMFTIMYAVGTLISQVAYPFISRVLTRKKIMMISFITIVIGYLALFFTGFPVFGKDIIANPASWTIWLLYGAGVIMFFGQGLYAVAIIMQMQSTIEYNEYKFGERKEALVSSMRALAAKFGSAIQRLLIFLTLLTSGLYAVSQVISNAEAELASGNMTSQQLTEKIDQARATITNGQWLSFSIGMLWVPLVLLIISLVLSMFVFK
ncbi:MAG: MFS transporter, partial [Bacilli bacterium]|nr:MFS transporter [Bacilli bacterium]